MKQINLAKKLGISGVEAKHIRDAFNQENLDIQSVDWKTVGEDSADFGDRYNTVWDKLGSMYGISKPQTHSELKHEIRKYEDRKPERNPNIGIDIQQEMIHQVHFSRTPRARIVDESLPAEQVFKASNLEGVQKWMKNPNRYDIHGVDFFGKIKRKRPGKQS